MIVNRHPAIQTHYSSRPGSFHALYTEDKQKQICCDVLKLQRLYCTVYTCHGQRFVLVFYALVCHVIDFRQRGPLPLLSRPPSPDATDLKNISIFTFRQFSSQQRFSGKLEVSGSQCDEICGVKGRQIFAKMAAQTSLETCPIYYR